MSKRPSVVFIADAHLRESAWVGRPILGDAFHALNQAITWSIEHEVDCVMGLGDLIDRQLNRSWPIAQWYGELDRLKAAGIQFHFIQGQHDMDDPPWLSVHPAASHAHRRVVNGGDFDIYSFDYASSETIGIELELSASSGASILCVHQVIGDFMGDLANPQMSVDDVPDCFRKLFFGDLHKTFHRRFPSKDLTAISPGSMCMQSIDEPVEKSFVVMDAGGGIHRVPLKSRQVFRSEVLTSAEMIDRFVSTDLPAALARCEEAAAGLPDSLKLPLVRVSYDPEIDDVRSRVEEIYRGKAHFFWKEELSPADDEARSVSAPRRGEAATLLSCLAEAAGDDEEVVALASRVLSSRNPIDELSLWEQEIVESTESEEDYANM